MTIDQINYFLEIAKCGSFLEATNNLHITQPTLSRQISNIEKELNVQLFFRTNHGVRLTPAGEALKQDWSKAVECYQSGVINAQTTFKGLTGTLSIGVLSGLKVEGFLPNLLEYMASNFPNVLIDIKRLSFRELVDQLSHHKLDLAFSMDVNFFDEKSIWTQNIRKYKPMFVFPKTSPLAKKDILEFSDFKDESLVIVNRQECGAGVDVIIDICKQLGGFFPRLEFVNSMDTVYLWIESGLKAALLNDQMQIVDSDHVCTWEFNDPTDKAYVQMGYLENNNNFAMQAALSYALKAYQNSI